MDWTKHLGSYWIRSQKRTCMSFVHLIWTTISDSQGVCHGRIRKPTYIVNLIFQPLQFLQGTDRFLYFCISFFLYGTVTAHRALQICRNNYSGHLAKPSIHHPDSYCLATILKAFLSLSEVDIMCPLNSAFVFTGLLADARNNHPPGQSSDPMNVRVLWALMEGCFFLCRYKTHGTVQ